MTLPTLLGNSLIGFLLVFLVLVILMAFIAVMNRIFREKEAQHTPIQESKKLQEIPEVQLYNISERDAAMVMAIVADESGIPLNELRFISIREVEE